MPERHLFGSLLVCLALGACGTDELRAELEAANVSSPRRASVGDQELVALGQLLFFDPLLSGNRDVACATCHLPEQHAADDAPIAIGQDGMRLSRNTLEPFNRSFAPALFWDGRVELRDGVIHAPVALPEGIDTLLEAQALLPLLDRREMRGQQGDRAVDGTPNELALFVDEDVEGIWSAIVGRVLSYEGYRAAFARAFPSVPLAALDITHVARALAAFEMHLWELADTAFDDYLGGAGSRGLDLSLTDEQRRGALLFFGEAGCARCHDGPLLSDGAYHDIGVPQIGPGRDARGADEGRFLVTGVASDRFAFRTPPLRNVALTAPYMHDGAYATLEDAVRHHLDPESALMHYDGAGLPADLRSQVHHELDELLLETLDERVRPLRPLREQEIQDLLAFLGSLSSVVEIFLSEGSGIPEAVPSGLHVVHLEDVIDR